MRQAVQVLKTEQFNVWLSQQPAKSRVILISRLDLISIGHWGDFKAFEGLIEFRWRNGTRVYAFRMRHDRLVILWGGNKNGQSRDVRKAKALRQEIIQANPDPT